MSDKSNLHINNADQTIIKHFLFIEIILGSTVYSPTMQKSFSST